MMTGTERSLQTELPKDLIEIRLKDVSDFLKGSLKTIFLFGLIMGIIGALYAFSLPDEFQSQLQVMPELQAGNGTSVGGLSSLAGLAGINLDNISSNPTVIRPDLYPTVLQSVPFILYLLTQPVHSKNFGTQMPFEEYLERQEANTLIRRLTRSVNTPPQPIATSAATSLVSLKKRGRTLRLTNRQEEIIRQIRDQIKVDIDKKNGVVLITAQMTDPEVSADVAAYALEYLTNYLTSYRTEKVRQQANFLNQRVEEAHRRYQATELALESFRDRNRNLFGNVAKLTEQRLQADFILAQTVYNDLSKQLEQAKIRVQEETPVFKMLEPPRVPLRKSAPKRGILILVIAVIGALIGLGYALIRVARQPKSTYPG